MKGARRNDGQTWPVSINDLPRLYGHVPFVLRGMLSSIWFILFCFVEHVRSKLSAQWTSGTIRLLEAKRKRNKQKQGWLVADGDPLCFEKPNVGYYYFSPFLWNSRKCLILFATIFTRQIILFLCFPFLFYRILFLWGKKPCFLYEKVILYR